MPVADQELIIRYGTDPKNFPILVYWAWSAREVQCCLKVMHLKGTAIAMKRKYHKEHSHFILIMAKTFCSVRASCLCSKIR